MLQGFFRWLSEGARTAVLHGVQEAVNDLQTVEPVNENGRITLQLQVVKPMALPAPTKQGKGAK